MICPSCKGEKKSMAFVDGYDEKRGTSWGEYREIQCYVCKGTGEIDDGYAARREWGDRMRHARIDRGLTLREMGEQLHIHYTRLSAIEHGIEIATDTERERIETALAWVPS